MRDQRDKTRIYARAGIVYYWIVNLVDLRIEVYSQPSGPTPLPAYGSLQLYQPGDEVPLILDGVTVAMVAAADLLPQFGGLAARAAESPGKKDRRKVAGRRLPPMARWG